MTVDESVFNESCFKIQTLSVDAFSQISLKEQKISRFSGNFFGKVIVAGPRTFINVSLIRNEMRNIWKQWGEFLLVSGMARGVDHVAYSIMSAADRDVIEMPADWDAKGRAAGFIRNAQMADVAAGALVFWDGRSKGSAHMIRLALEKKLRVRVVAPYLWWDALLEASTGAPKNWNADLLNGTEFVLLENVKHAELS